jgi:uncharacterized protein YhjY with autotransporter beta-barrel domain
MKPSFRRSIGAAAFVLALANSLQAQTPVSTAAGLQLAIDSGDTSIQLTAPITLTTPINIGTTSSPTITINGAGNSITGTSEIFFVQSGNISISNTTLTGTAVGGSGGSGQSSGGGALGAGGAIFVGATASVTVSGVQFTNNSATGGNGGAANFNGGYGGGGGMNGGTGGLGIMDGGGGGGGNGGVGGSGIVLVGGGGGGLNSAGGAGHGATGGNGGGPNGGAGTVIDGQGATGPNSGGGGAGALLGPGGNGTTNGGGGGGVIIGNGGNAGDYAGGGGDEGPGGNGGFGGGSGGGAYNGGAAGFGAGGGGGTVTGGTAGVAGGNGAVGTPAQGGGGAGLGGAIFVQPGGQLIITGNNPFTGSSTTAGTGSNAGAAVGSDLFLVTGATTTIAPGTGNTITFNGTIADDSLGSLPMGAGYSYGNGAGAAIAFGATGAAGGTVNLLGVNTYSGGTTISNNVTVVADNTGALGLGPVNNTGGTLTVGTNNHTIGVSAFTQAAPGVLLLNVNGAGAGALADLLHVTNTAPNQANLGGALDVNFSGFTIPHGSPHTFELPVVEADGGYTGTFTSFDAIGLQHAKVTLDYTTNPDDVFLQINLSLGIPTLGLTPNQQAPLGPINAALNAGSGSSSLAKLSGALSALSGPAALGGALDELSPIKFNHFASTTAFNNESFEVQNTDSYLAGLRQGPHGTFLGGNGQIDASGLTVNDPNIDPGLQVIHSRMLAWNGPSSLVTDVPGAVLGGIDMKDVKPCTTCCAPSTNPWNVFLRGNVILAQGFSQADQPHFDDNTESVVLGADYRFTPNFLVGLTAGYAHTDATLDTANSSATVDSYSPGLCASYADKGWYANLIGRYSYNSYTENRVISFLGQSASGSPDGNEGMADLDGGYDFHWGALTYGPVAGLQYTHLTLNGYSESGSDANLGVTEDQSDSLRSRLGASVRYNLRGFGVEFTPHLTASWQHEFLDESRGITSQFTNFGGGSFVVRTQNSSDDSALVDAGLDAQINKTVTIYGDYLIQAGQDNYFGQSVEAGVRVNF